ncbi:hypothetical protein BST61_g68 [Cercospora zeina]
MTLPLVQQHCREFVLQTFCSRVHKSWHFGSAFFQQHHLRRAPFFHHQMEKPEVPKFSSFKPKPKKIPQPQADEVRKDNSEDDQRDRNWKPRHREHRAGEYRERERRDHRPHRKHRNIGSHGEHRHHARGSRDDSPHSRRRSRERGVEHRVQDRTNVTTSSHRETDDLRKRDANSDPVLEESDLFLIDRRGDSKNVEYGGLHRYSIPPYRRAGYGRVIGLNANVKIDRDTSTDKDIVLMHTRERESHNAPRLLTSRHARPKEGRYRFIASAALDNVAQIKGIESDYIDLRSSRKRKRNPESPEPGVDYRSIEGKAKSQPVDEDLTLDSDSDVDALDHDRDLAARQQNALLSKQAKAKPRDVQVWQALIVHQAKLVNPGKTLSTFTSSERRTLGDLRLSIIREAQANISNGMAGYDNLVLAMIEEGSFTWDSSKRAQKWEEALQECPTSILLWTRYLNHVQDSPLGFRYENCKEAYMRCLGMLHQASQNATDKQSQAIAAVQIYVLLRFTIFMREAGYIELSIAVWQALLEWNLRIPADFQNTKCTGRLSALEDFWDSECARLGEPDAAGWSNYHASGTAPTRVPEISNDATTASSTLANALTAEGEWTRSLCLSTTADDDAAVEDPFRYVMFSDIREVLQRCDGLGSYNALLVHAMLFFLGMPSLPFSSDETDATRHFSSQMRDAHLARTRDSRACGSDGSHDQVRSRSMLETTESLFDESAFDVRPSAVEFSDRMLEQLLAIRFDEGLAEYLLAYKHRHFPDRAPKTAKELLKSHPSSLRLYNAYALLQVARNEEQGLQKAVQVWSTAINMRSSLPADKQDDVVLLWHSRLLCVARKTPDSRALLSSLMTICESSGDAKMLQLKVRRELEHGFDRMLLGERHWHAAMYADLIAWLAYLSSGYAIEAGLEVYAKYAQLLTKMTSSISLEYLLQHKAVLLNMHLSHRRAYKPAVLRKQVDDDLQRFPSNGVFLALRSRLSNNDRLREVIMASKLDEAAPEPHKEHSDMVRWTHALANELSRVEDQDSSGVTMNTIRAVFANAISDPDSQIKHSPTLWKLWLEWEYTLAHGAAPAANEKAMKRTKQVLLDGMRHVPWHLGHCDKDHRYSLLTTLQEMEESPPPPPVPPKDAALQLNSAAMDVNRPPTAPASGSKRRRDAIDDANYHYSYRNDPSDISDNDRPTPSKRSRSQVRANDGYVSDTPSQQAAQLRRKKGIRNLSNVNLRHAASTSVMPRAQDSPPRESRFQEGSLTDKPSQQPPSVFTRLPRSESGNLSYVDELMADYHDDKPAPARDIQATIEHEKHIMQDRVAEINARDKKDDEGGVFRFGKSWGSSFKPIALWKSLWNDTKEELTRQNRLEAQRKARLKAEAEAKYAQMKNAGQFAPTQATPRDSGVVVDHGATNRTSTDSHRRYALDEQSTQEASEDGHTTDATSQALQSGEEQNKAVVKTPQVPVPPRTIRGRLSRIHLRKPSLGSLTGTVKRAKSDWNLAASQREASASISPTKAEFDGSASILRSSASKYDLKKHDRLSKRVSNLEEKLYKARMELDNALAEASPVPKLSSKFERFTPVSSVKSSYKRSRFVPGALPTLPSERVLFPGLRGPETYEETVPRAEEATRTRPEIDLATAFDNVDDEQTARQTRASSLRPHAKDIFKKPDDPKKEMRRESNEENRDPAPAESKGGEADIEGDHEDNAADADDDKAPRNGPLVVKLKTKKTGKSKKRRSLADDDEVFHPDKVTSDDDAEWEEAAHTSNKKKRKSAGKTENSPAGKNASSAPEQKSPQNKTTKKTTKKTTTMTESKNKAGTEKETVEVEEEKMEITEDVALVPSEDELARPQSEGADDAILEPVYEEEEETSIMALQDEPSNPTATATPSKYGRHAVRSRSNSPLKRNTRGMSRLGVAASSPGTNGLGQHIRSVSDGSIHLAAGGAAKRDSKDEDFEWPDDVF